MLQVRSFKTKDALAESWFTLPLWREDDVPLCSKSNVLILRISFSESFLADFYRGHRPYLTLARQRLSLFSGFQF